MINVTCIECHNEFEAMRKDRKYCPICKAKRRSIQVMQARKKSVPTIELGVGSGNSSKNRGVTHGSYTTGIAAYRKMIPTNKCEKCGATKNLLIHHKDEDRLHNEPSNLVCWCRRCHQAHHTQRDSVTQRYCCKSNTEVSE